MSPRLLYLITVLLVAACTQPEKGVATRYTTVDYLEVARFFRDSVRTFPGVIDINHGKKRLIFIGTAHTNQVTHQADSIERIFERFDPQIAFNEGGEIDEAVHFASRDEAIGKNGETGELKFLCDAANIRMINGDLEDSVEWAELFRRHSRDEVLLYMSNERFIDLYAKAWIDTTAGIEVTYQHEFVDYYTKRGIRFMAEEQRFDHIRKIYSDYFHQDLDIHHIPADSFYFLNDGGKLCALGRHSKEIRDQALLTKIERAFQTYDRVMVVFGGAHAIALKPALHQLMDRLD